MASYNELAVITDPDELAFEVDPVNFAAAVQEIVIDTTAKTIALKVIGNLTKDGATIKSVYSKLKDAWRADTTLVKFLFPMGPITDEQYELINGWNWDKTNTSGESQTTPELLRTGGWSVVNTGGNITELWVSAVTLGVLDDTDQVYYQLVNSDTASTNFTLTGKVNQAIQILDDPNGDAVYTDGFDRRYYLKLFVREWQKLYAQSDIIDIGITTMSYQAYRFPLTSSIDLKVTVNEVDIDVNSDGTPDVGVYTNINIQYLRDANGDRYDILGTWVTATPYVVGQVTQSPNNSRWYKCVVNVNNTTDPALDGGSNWVTYEGERQIGISYYAFDVIVDADTTVGPTASGSARTIQVYEAVQYYLRQNTDVDASIGAVTGKTAGALLIFVGDTLVTSPGVYIDSFNSQDTNVISFTDYSSTVRTFPFVAALTVNFGDNLQNDQFSRYWVFFGNANGNLFNTTSAIIVQDADDLDMVGDVNPGWPTKRSSVSHTFNYDSNVQGGRTAGADASIVAVGIGLSNGQYVRSTGTIARSTANSVALISALERNYSQGTTYP